MKKPSSLITTLVILDILVIAFFAVKFTLAAYPMVGGDYSLFGPRLIDSLLHYKVNGLTIQWYTPSFGGGLPAYPNPLQMQYSLLQFFTFFANPLTAILLSAMVYIAIGFWITYLFLHDPLEFSPLSAVLGASFFVGSGFFIERLVIGHADKISFPLVVIPLYALFSRKLPAWLAGILIALTGAVLLYSGGVYIAVLCLFTALVTIPLVYLLKPALFDWHRMLPVLTWGVVLTLLLCGSKLNAASALMSSFPRQVQDNYFVPWLTALGGLVFQLIGVMTTLPFLHLLGKSSLVYVARLTQWTGSPYGFWELDSSISPILILLLGFGVWKVFSRRPHFDRSGLLKKGIYALFLVLSIILVIQYSTARGFLFELTRVLPVFQSLRTNTRFVAAFILPLAILGARIFSEWSNGKPTGPVLASFAILDGISLLALWAYYLLPLEVQGRNFDIQIISATYSQVQSGERFPVDKIIPDMNDYEVFQARASNVTRHYDPIYGENSFHPLVHAGSVFETENGYFNMTDPSGYVFPAENGSTLFSRIPLADREKLDDLINRRQPGYKIPLVQILLDWAAGLTFISITCALIIFYLSKLIRGHPVIENPQKVVK